MNALQLNQVLQQRYIVVRLIAQGGFGAVYEALDERLNRRVALKQLVRITDRTSRQFTREAQLLANLDHPYLPRVTDYFTDIAGQFLVMDYIPGDDLGMLLEQRGAPFPVPDVLRWGDQLLDALHYLHTRTPEAIIHRDIKPQNLKLKPNGDIIMLDFGLAKGRAGEHLSSGASRSIMAFTRGFAPFEQEEGLGTDARSDLHALGATLYCLLTVEPLPDAQTRMLKMTRGRGDPVLPAHQLNRDVPPGVSQVLQRAMALDRDDRPADALAMRAMLHAARERVMPAVPAPKEPVQIEAMPKRAAWEIDPELLRVDIGPPVIWLPEPAKTPVAANAHVPNGDAHPRPPVPDPRREPRHDRGPRANEKAPARPVGLWVSVVLLIGLLLFACVFRIMG